MSAGCWLMRAVRSNRSARRWTGCWCSALLSRPRRPRHGRGQSGRPCPPSPPSATASMPGGSANSLRCNGFCARCWASTLSRSTPAAKAFVDDVVGRVGMDGFNRVWEGPATLPCPDEIDQPQRWIDRCSEPGALRRARLRRGVPARCRPMVRRAVRRSDSLALTAAATRRAAHHRADRRPRPAARLRCGGPVRRRVGHVVGMRWRTDYSGSGRNGEAAPGGCSARRATPRWSTPGPAPGADRPRSTIRPRPCCWAWAADRDRARSPGSGPTTPWCRRCWRCAGRTPRRRARNWASPRGAIRTTTIRATPGAVAGRGATLFEEVLGGGVAEALARTATALRSDGDLLDALADQALAGSRAADGGPGTAGCRAGPVAGTDPAAGHPRLAAGRRRGAADRQTDPGRRCAGGGLEGQGGVAVGSELAGQRLFAGRRDGVLMLYSEPLGGSPAPGMATQCRASPHTRVVLGDIKSVLSEEQIRTHGRAGRAGGPGSPRRGGTRTCCW